MKEARDIFTKRGISVRVREARPYVRFERAQYDDVLAADRDLPETYLKWLGGMSHGGGWAMLKTPISGEPPIRTQFRPDNPVPKRERDGSITEAKYLFRRGPRERYSHLHPLKRHQWDDPRTGGTRMERHELWRERTDKHVKKKHPGIDADDGWMMPLHEHESPRKDPDVSLEKRLDMHPLSAELLPSAERVFFVIEGVLKADALLSAGECAFDVPSVSMWRAPELERFAQARLQGRPVYVVPDGDWRRNEQVALQAFDCREALRGWGVRAQVAAPPLEDGHEEKDCKRRDCTKGVDDFLGLGHEVEELIVTEREMSPGFNGWASDQYGGDNRSDRVETDVAVMEWLALHANQDGVTLKVAQTIAAHVGRSDKVVATCVDRLAGEGHLIVEGKFAWSEARFIRVRRRRKPLNLGPGWREAERLIVAPELRADEDDFTLGEVEARQLAS
ncbi:MAG: DUF3854 domain-containing protein [Actinomycetota bacterium]|nr:DUF3854 domain-containing protein [Actinomycetota bacterium]